MLSDQPVTSPPGGCFNRQIDLHHHDAHTVVGWLEDDFHHFGLSLSHTDGTITAIRTRAVRYPWSTCSSAGGLFQQLVGQPLQSRSTAIGALLDMRQQCTHLFDLCGLVMAHAGKTIPRRRYHAIVDDRPVVGYKGPNPVMGSARARLLCDGELVADWQIDGARITSGSHGEQHMGKGFRAWTETLELESGEHATVLRRAILVSGGRTFNHEDFANAAATGNPPLCYAYQAERAASGIRKQGQSRDYAGNTAAMLPLVELLP